jgi:hypothetical protein
LIEVCDLGAEHLPDASNCIFFDLGQIARVHSIALLLFGIQHGTVQLFQISCECVVLSIVAMAHLERFCSPLWRTFCANHRTPIAHKLCAVR